MKKVLKVILWVLLAIVILAAALIAWLSITEYKPAPVEQLSVTAAPGSQPIDTAQTLEILSWNIGYAGLGDKAHSDRYLSEAETMNINHQGLQAFKTLSKVKA